MCLAPYVSVSSALIDFTTCILSGKSSMLPPYEAQLQLTSEHDEAVTWSLRAPAGDGGSDAFWVSDRGGTIGARAGVASVTVFYQPKTSAHHETRLELHASVPGADELKILDVCLRGTGRKPQLLFDTTHVVLPATPLGVASHTDFGIVNDGYDNVDLRYQLPADEEHLPLRLSFPEGTMIGIAKERIPVRVHFQAQRATSFTARLAFLDDEGATAVDSGGRSVACRRHLSRVRTCQGGQSRTQAASIQYPYLAARTTAS